MFLLIFKVFTVSSAYSPNPIFDPAFILIWYSVSCSSSTKRTVRCKLLRYMELRTLPLVYVNVISYVRLPGRVPTTMRCRWR